MPPLTGPSLEERLRRVNHAIQQANEAIQQYHGARGRINAEIIALTEHFTAIEAEVVKLREEVGKPRQCSTCGWKLTAKGAAGRVGRFDPDTLPPEKSA